MFQIIPNNIHLRKINNNDKLFSYGKENIKNNTFMSSSRKLYFIKNYNNLWETKNNNTTIYIYLTTPNINLWKQQLKKIFGRVNFIRIYAKNNKPLIIWIYPSKHKKIIPNNKIITTDDINSGNTTTYLNSSDNGEICLWREEELPKVLLHELIHAFKLDKNHPVPNEAYTELKALIANIYLELLERQIPLSEENINKLINHEKIFGIHQSQKIKTCKNQNTNIIYYINEKSRLLHDLDTKSWENIIKNTQIKKPYVNKKSLRFTITDVILQNCLL